MGTENQTKQQALDLIDREQVLIGALLWLRNHYELCDSLIKARVLATTDRVLKEHDVSREAMASFAERYLKDRSM